MENFQIIRAHVHLMQVLDGKRATNSLRAMTITEVMEALEDDNNKKNRMTVYRRFRQLVNAGYVSKGIPDNHADTFFLNSKGASLLSGIC